MTAEEAYRSGQWRSFDRILALLQTYERDHVSRKQIYRDIMELRPKPFDVAAGPIDS